MGMGSSELKYVDVVVKTIRDRSYDASPFRGGPELRNLDTVVTFMDKDGISYHFLVYRATSSPDIGYHRATYLGSPGPFTASAGDEGLLVYKQYENQHVAPRYINFYPGITYEDFLKKQKKGIKIEVQERHGRKARRMNLTEEEKAALKKKLQER